jgi:hypothetical protein
MVKIPLPHPSATVNVALAVADKDRADVCEALAVPLSCECPDAVVAAIIRILSKLRHLKFS